ncbi:MAG: mandelate racemase/muconate lactonizing enzyme family protein [Candidatus Bipolaricaulota bacterium]|nr:mandelate racemase/muconate lactonizing enzyme family protein [Candidatus Bipolaricaulota bacterium]MDW8030777.1 mandelate racemase/muconate lactonizing enzyme family protein [Candidatus Bipolaricaulota bacterium]
MRITSVTVKLLEYPLEQPFYPAWLPGYPQAFHRVNLVIVETDEGIKGYSAGFAFGQEGSKLGELLAPFLLGCDPFNVEEIVKILRSATFLGLRLWYVEPALWDIIGKALNVPVYKLLGGYQERIKAYASTGELKGVEERLEYIEQIQKLGFRAVKLRFHSLDWREDLKVARAVREHFPKIDLMVDANMGWRVAGLGEAPQWDLATAQRIAEELKELGVLWLEEPLEKNDYHGYRLLRRRVGIALAGGEMNSDLHEFRELILNQSLDILQPDAILSGGILTARKIAAMAEAWGLRIAPHTWTNGLGLAANLHVMGASPNCEWAEFPYEPPGWTPQARDFFLKKPLMIDADGYITVPSGPGLGVELDESAIARYAKG